MRPLLSIQKSAKFKSGLVPIPKDTGVLTNITNNGAGFQVLQELFDPRPGPVLVVRDMLGYLLVNIMHIGLFDGHRSGFPVAFLDIVPTLPKGRQR